LPEAAGPFSEEFIMTYVRVEQRHAHLAGPVRLYTREGSDGPIAQATLTAISNTRRRRRGASGGGEEVGETEAGAPSEEEATAIQWTLWGRLAQHAVLYLGQGSHVNLVGRVQNHQYEKDGETVYTLGFTAEAIDYLDTKAQGEVLRARQGPAPEAGDSAPQGKPAARARATKLASRHQAADPVPAAKETDDIPF
jgi:single-strand DNA-binding protein